MSLCSQCLLKIGFDTGTGMAQEDENSEEYRPRFLPPTVQELAPHFPHLEILEVLGHGGMGIVYKARQVDLDRFVALKILRPSISLDQGFAERFLREARALAKLNHPNIITVFDFGRKDSLYYFIMEFVDGTNLRQVERSGQLSPAAALAIVPQICSALQYAHDNGVVHRDIKPENILLTTTGEVRIADFGLAKIAGSDEQIPLTGTWQVMGTPHYMAPEQFEKPATVDHRADIYSLGVVIYELLTGELPIGRFQLPSERAKVDARLDEVVMKSLDKEPNRRYQRVTDVASAVEAASSPSPRAFAGVQAMAVASTLADWKRRFEPVIAWCGERTKNIGMSLILVGFVNAGVAIAQRSKMFDPNQHISDMEFPVMASSGLAAWFGMQLLRKNVSSLLRVLGLLCLLPVVTDAILPDVCRMLFMALGLLASMPSIPLARPDWFLKRYLICQPDTKSLSLDHALGMFLLARKHRGLRRVLFSHAMFSILQKVGYRSWKIPSDISIQPCSTSPSSSG